MKKEILYENIFSSLNDGIMVVSRNMEIILINPAIENLCSISEHQFLNKSFSKAFRQNSHLIDLVQKVFLAGQTVFEFEYSFTDKFGKTIPVDITVSPLSGQGYSIAGAVLSMKDLRRIGEFKERDPRHKWLDNMGIMASGMAHEIKNPLGGIRGAAQLLQVELEKDDLKEYLDIVIKEVDRINNIVEDVLSSTKPKKIKFKPVNIHKIIGDILLLQKESPIMKNIEVKLNYDPSLPPVKVDEEKLKQVFLNLFKNSFEAMKNKGTLTITTKIDTGFQIFSKKNDSPVRMLLIEIKDTGEGIPEEMTDKLFTPFFTTKSKGSGLGLFISHKIIEEHEGRLQIVNNKDKGATSKVFVPFKTK